MTTEVATLPAPEPAWVAAERYQRSLPEPIEVENGSGRVRYPDDVTLEEVLAEILADYHEEPLYRGMDLTVRRNGYLAAVIHQGRDGNPVLTRFDFEW